MLWVAGGEIKCDIAPFKSLTALPGHEKSQIPLERRAWVMCPMNVFSSQSVAFIMV